MTDAPTTSFDVDIPDEIYKDLATEAAKAGVAVEDYIANLLMEYCKEIVESEDGVS